MTDPYDPSQLRTFLAVAQTRSFTQAAVRLGIRQPTVSQHVRKLEEATGRVLVLRDTHSVALTPRRRGDDRVRPLDPRVPRAGGPLLQRRPAARPAADRDV